MTQLGTCLCKKRYQYHLIYIYDIGTLFLQRQVPVIDDPRLHILIGFSTFNYCII